MKWKTTWSYLPINYNTNIGTARNITQRAFFKNNLNGTKIRIKFTNLYSRQTMTLDHVVLGKMGKENTVLDHMIEVTYQGRRKIVIEPGKEFFSDEIDFPITCKEDIVLSIYINAATDIYSHCATWAARSWHSAFGIDGDYTLDQSFTETDNKEIFPVLQFDQSKSSIIVGISSIQVYTADNTKTLSMFGDSITHMSYYSDALTEKLFKAFPGELSVVNRGIGGNRLLHDYTRVPQIPGGGTIFGTSGVERFLGDVFTDEEPDYVFVLIGINDFSHPYALNHEEEKVTIEEYQNGITRLITTAHERGSKIWIGTVTPMKFGEVGWFSKFEELRTKANDWIRNQKLSDGIIDFDRVIRKPDDEEAMQEDCHLGDGLHPNTAGGKKMADLVPYEWFD